jgi:hypothetical protein
MDDKELNELIVVKQLPEITQQLQLISDEIDKEIEYALSLDCTEESKSEVKKARARLNNINKTLDEKRKEVKRAILSPYEAFEEIYDNLVKNKLNEADNTLKTRVEAIENEQLNSKRDNLIGFAVEYFKKYNIPAYVTFSDIGLNITLSASEKSLKEQIVNFCEKIDNDLQLIRLEENGIEIENEYSINGFDYAKAKLTVIDRHKKLEELAKVKQELDNKKEQEEKIVEQVEEIIAPVELEEQLNEDIKFDERLECTFTVWATKEELKQIREMLMKMGLKFQ